MPPGDHRVTLLTRAGCHLCDEAETVLRRLATEWGFAYREIDLDGLDPALERSAALRDEFADRLPVVLVDGKEHGYWRVEEKRLRAALSR